MARIKYYNSATASWEYADTGAGIDDSKFSSTTTYSSQKIEAELNEIDEALNNKLFAHVGTEEPTDPAIKVWVNPEGEVDEIPIASPTTLGGVMPVAKTDSMTQEIGVDEFGGLWALPGGGTSEFTRIIDVTLEEDVAEIIIPTTEDIKNGINNAKEITISLSVYQAQSSTATETGNVSIMQRYSWGDGDMGINNISGLMINSSNAWQKVGDLRASYHVVESDTAFAQQFGMPVFLGVYLTGGFNTNRNTATGYFQGVTGNSIVIKTNNNNLFGIGTKFIVAVR